MTTTLTKSISRLLFLATALGVFAAPAWALDGQKVIKQFPTTVFPILIKTSGSYVVTTNIVPTSTTVDAIDVNADDVSINLNGFSIIGPGSGSGIGINSPANHSGISVTNGTVTAMGRTGIQLGDNAHVEGVNAISNGNTGIAAGNNSEIDDCAGNSNAGSGFVCLNDCVVHENTADANGGDGMFINAGGTVTRNVANENVQFGIATGTNTGYGKNVFSGNSVGCITFGTSMGDNVCNGSRL